MVTFRAKMSARTALFTLFTTLSALRTPFLVPNHLFKLRSSIMLVPEMPQERPVMLDHFEAKPALVPTRGILEVQSWILGAVLFLMFFYTLRMAKFIATELTGILLSSVNSHVLFELSLGSKELPAMCTTKLGNFWVMGLHVHLQGVRICIIFFAQITIVISLLEVLALYVVPKFLSVVVTFVAQLALEIFPRQSFQNVLKSGFLVCLANIRNANLLAQLLPPENANQQDPVSAGRFSHRRVLFSHLWHLY